MKEIIRELLAYNSNFSSNRSDHYAAFVNSQHPNVTLIACSDSRVPPHCLHADTVNNVFTIENMGNQVKTAAGTLDYGILHLNTPLLVILGHTNCGAVNASLTDYKGETDAIKQELDSLVEGYKKQSAHYGKEAPKRADMYAEKNVDFQVSEAVSKYSKQIADGNLMVLGMMFDFAKTYGDVRGRAYITNCNGKTDISDIVEMTGEKDRVKRITE